jgi:peptidoglycan/LPS O-acetylase OafA/YrhL
MINQQNNLNLIRLLASMQVAVGHIFGAYGYQDYWFLQILGAFPGVPVFFCISGFLIAKSYENTNLADQNITFYKKRLYRVFPGLFIATSVSIFLLIISGYLSSVSYSSISLFIWLICQYSIFQFYTPYFLRDYGVGSFNGIAWSLFVEIQFYLLYPLIKNLRLRYILLISVVSIFINQYSLSMTPEDKFLKYINISLVPWFYMFIFGILIFRIKNSLVYIDKIPFLPVIFIYILSYYYFGLHELGGGNKLNPLSFILLIILIFKVAFYKKYININYDTSYGIYLYHMGFLNFILYINIFDAGYSIVIVGLATLAASFLSYRYVESRFIMN